jgi:hypothetical protein
MGLNILENPQTYGPKGFFLGVWIVTTVMGVGGIALAIASQATWWFWVVILLLGLRQLWVTRWVQVDREGIRTRNVFGRGRSLTWEGLTDVDERTFPIRKEKFFSIITLQGISDVRRGKEDKIKVDSDINGFDILRQIILTMAPATELVQLDPDITTS